MGYPGPSRSRPPSRPPTPLAGSSASGTAGGRGLEQLPAGGDGGGRQLLRWKLDASISTDAERSWSAPRTIARVAESDSVFSQVSYPYLVETGSGGVLVKHSYVPNGDWDRAQDRLVLLDPEWLSMAR